MKTVTLQFESRIAATPAEAWRWSTSIHGVSMEMRPLLKVTFPHGMSHIPEHGDSLGKPLGNCKFLLLGLVPVDLSRLTFTEVEPGKRFVEESPLLSMKRWRHERTVTPSGDGAIVTDKLEFTPRFAAGVVAWFTGRLFKHRHAMLRRQFGGVAAPASRTASGAHAA
jgi:ligand-binding SRPBCC domain-containing protein